MRKLIFIISIVAIFLLIETVQGQSDAAFRADTLEVAYDNPNFDKSDIESYLQKKKLKVNVEVGTTFGTSFGSGSYWGTYIAPHVSYPVSNRFTLKTGGYLLNTYGINNNYSEGVIYPYNPFSGNMTRTFLYVEGAYKLNENITLTGAAFKEFNVFNEPSPNSSGQNYDYEGFIMGVDYRLGNNVFIRGQVEISNGRSPNRYSPFHPAAGAGIPGTHDPFTPGF